MKRGIIYLITNNINGKKYVGQTTTPLSYRFTNHKSDARNNRGYYLASAIRKYGEDNFKIEALFECNEWDLNINEIEQIRLLNTKAPNGYNLTDGGDICFRRPEFESSDIIEKFNELKTASAVSKFFKTDIQNITRILKENNIHYGTALSNCQKRKIFEMLENGYKPIEISRHLGLHRSTVRKFLKRI